MPDLEEDDSDDAETELPPSAVEASKVEEDLIAKCNNAIAVLMEHCDSVQVICTRVLPISGGTIRVGCGGGNWFARLGSVQSWLKENSDLA